MNFTPMLETILPVALLVTAGIFVAAFLKSQKVKGYIGEKSVQLITSLRLDTAVYRRIDDVTLEDSRGTTQIDHVFVSEYGVFVVETKNMQGWIFGGENQAEWTQKIFKKSSKFQNPLRQNHRHVKALEALLTVPPTAIHSVVVFVGDCEFKTPMPKNVTQHGGLATYIKSFKSPVLTKEQVLQVSEKIERTKLPATKETTQKHVESLKARAKIMDVGQFCPKCGSSLVVRTAKSGAQVGSQFMGCSSFPKCRYTCAVT